MKTLRDLANIEVCERDMQSCSQNVLSPSWYLPGCRSTAAGPEASSDPGWPAAPIGCPLALTGWSFPRFLVLQLKIKSTAEDRLRVNTSASLCNVGLNSQITNLRQQLASLQRIVSTGAD